MRQIYPHNGYIMPHCGYAVHRIKLQKVAIKFFDDALKLLLRKDFCTPPINTPYGYLRQISKFSQKCGSAVRPAQPRYAVDIIKKPYRCINSASNY